MSYANDIIDIYSNSWGPCDGGCVGGPERLTQMTLKNGAQAVSTVCSGLAAFVTKDNKNRMPPSPMLHASDSTTTLA